MILDGYSDENTVANIVQSSADAMATGTTPSSATTTGNQAQLDTIRLAADNQKRYEALSDWNTQLEALMQSALEDVCGH